MQLEGRDNILSGVASGDAPVPIALIDIDGRVGPQGIRIDGHDRTR